MTVIEHEQSKDWDFNTKRSQFDAMAEQWSRKAVIGEPSNLDAHEYICREVNAVSGFESPRYFGTVMVSSFSNRKLLLIGAKSAFDMSGRHSFQPTRIGSGRIKTIMRDDFVAATAGLKRAAKNVISEQPKRSQPPR